MGAEVIWPFPPDGSHLKTNSGQEDDALLLSDLQQQHAAVADGAPVQPELDASSQPSYSTPMMRLQGWLWSSGTACILLAAFIFSLSSLSVKLTGGRVPVLEITLIRSFLSFLVSAGLIRGRGLPMFGSRDKLPWLLARGIFGASAMIAFYACLLFLPIADAMTLFFLNPAITALVAWAIAGESLGLLGVAGVLCSLAGLVVLVHPPLLFGGHADWGPKRLWGTGFGIIAGVAAAGAFISIRFVGKSEPAIVVALYFHTCTMGMSLLPLAVGWPQRALVPGWHDALLLLAIAVTSFTAQLCLTRGFQLEPASKASGLNFSQVVYSYIFGILFFSEHLTLFGVLGTLLIALGMTCVTSRSNTVQPSDKTDLARNIAAAGFGSAVFDRAARAGSFMRLLSAARIGSSSSSSHAMSLPLQDAAATAAAAAATAPAASSPAAAGTGSERVTPGGDDDEDAAEDAADDRQPLLVVTHPVVTHPVVTQQGVTHPGVTHQGVTHQAQAEVRAAAEAVVIGVAATCHHLTAAQQQQHHHATQADTQQHQHHQQQPRQLHAAGPPALEMQQQQQSSA